MKKKIFLVTLILLVIFSGIKLYVSAEEGTGGTGDGTSGTVDGSGGWQSSVFGVFITVYDKNNVKQGSSIEITEATISDNWIQRNSDGTWTAYPTYLYGYLGIPYGTTGGDYSTLNNYISSIGISSGGYVLIEPYTQIGTSKLTFRQIINDSTEAVYEKGTFAFYAWYENPAIILANAAKVGHDITVGGNTYKARNDEQECNTAAYSNKSFCGYTNDHYVGYGVTVVTDEQLNPSGTLEVIKKDTLDRTIYAKSVKFNIYEGSNCSSTAIKTLAFNTTDIGTMKLKPGNYSIKEIEAPLNYKKDDSCHDFNIKRSETTSLTIRNELTCLAEYELLDSKKNDPIERLKIYTKYLAKGLNYKDLLNFNSPSANPCQNTSSCSNKIGMGCLSATSSTPNFSSTNLSCYNETIEVDGLTGYCGLEFTLYNRLANLNNENRYTFENSYTFPTITAGQMFLKSENKKIALGNIVKTCYVYDINGTGVSDYSNNSSYNSYIDNLKFSGIELDKKLSVSDWGKTTSGNLTTFKQEYSSEYYLPRAYAHKGNGSVVYTEPSDFTKYKDLGYGFVSKLNDDDGDIDVPFSFNVVSKSINDGSDGTLTATKYTCKYLYDREIIPGEKEKLALEFRTIDTKNPFPGKNGTSRKTGKNWCDNGNCTITNNNLIKNVIKDRIDSNYRCNAKYEITLSPKDIGLIRKYNKETTYDDYTLTCDGYGQNCKSSFLSMLENGVLDLKNSSMATLTNRLIRTEINSIKSKIENPSCQYADVPFEEKEPVEITLKGDNPLILKNKSFESQDPGYLLTGANDDIFVEVYDDEVSDEPGEYNVEYSVIDYENVELTSVQRTIIVPQKPIISLAYSSETYYDTNFYFDTSNVDYDAYVDDEYIDDYEVIVCDDYDCYDYGEDIYIEDSTNLKYKITDEYGYTDYQYFYIEIVEDDYDNYDDYDGYNCMSSDCYIEEEGYVECYYGDQGDFEEYNYKYIYDNGNSVFLLDGSEESINSPSEICQYLGFEDYYYDDEYYDEQEEQYACDAGYEDGYNDYGEYSYNYDELYRDAYLSCYNDGVYDRENPDNWNYYDPDEGYLAGCEDGNWGDEPYCDENEYGYEYCESYYEGFRTGMWEYCY